MLQRPAVLALILPVLACGGASSPAPEEPGAPSDPGPVVPGGPSDGKVLTSEECGAQGGTVVGDIGDGAIHRPGWTCPGGSPPIGKVQLGVEGSVCCPGGAPQGSTTAP